MFAVIKTGGRQYRVVPDDVLEIGKIAGDVALITSLPGVGSLGQRRQGFMEQLAAKSPDLKLVADKTADGMATTGLNITTDLLTANPNLVGIFASNLIMAQGAAASVRDVVMPFLAGLHSVEEKMIRQLSEIEINYRNSPIVGSDWLQVDKLASGWSSVTGIQPAMRACSAMSAADRLRG